jgi:predicted RNA methylase
MSVIDSQQELNKITQVILNDELNYKELFDTIDDFFCLLQKASQMDINEPVEREAVYLPTGKAIGTVWAGMCVKEIMRTRQFTRGIIKSVRKARELFPDTKLHILYAGTGPFATLILPLTTLFSSDDLEFTLLEINPKSIELLNNTISFFGIEKYIKSIIQVDATLYKATQENKPIHIIISETMLNALQKEPQVAITLNLAPQLVSNGILIPQNISIDAGLLSFAKRTQNMEGKTPMEECHKILETVFQLNKDNLPQPISTSSGDLFNEVRVEIPQEFVNDYSQLCLFTTIQVFEDEYLTHWQSSLTIPKIILNLQNHREQNQIGLQYCLNNTPGFLLNLQ